MIDENVDVTIHEAAHVLRMSSNSYQYFWDLETGKPRITRGFTTQLVKCVNDIEGMLVMPDENTLVGIHHFCYYVTNVPFVVSCSYLTTVPFIVPVPLMFLS